MGIFGYKEPDKKYLDDFCQVEMNKIDKEFSRYNLSGKADYIYKNSKYSSEEKLVLLVTYVQKGVYGNFGREFILHDGSLDFLFRGILDLIYHMPNDVPMGVYNYISSGTGSMVTILEQLDKENEKAIKQGKMYRIDDYIKCN